MDRYFTKIACKVESESRLQVHINIPTKIRSHNFSRIAAENQLFPVHKLQQIRYISPVLKRKQQDGQFTMAKMKEKSFRFDKMAAP